VKNSSENLDHALQLLHTPDSFGRAVLSAALRTAKDQELDEMDARIALSDPNPDGTIPVCFFLFHHEICISLPVT